MNERLTKSRPRTPRRQSLGSVSRVAMFVALFLTTAVVGMAQEYTEVSRLGTSNAFCKPGISTGDELQSFFASNPEDVISVLRQAGWDGDPQDVLNAVANGDFSDSRHPKGTEFAWMAVRKNGEPVAAPFIRWASDDPFEAFEVRIRSQCSDHRLLVPKACCNLSLLSTVPVPPPPTPNLRVTQSGTCSGSTVTIEATANGMPEDGTMEVVLRSPDGSTQTLNLDASGKWEGRLDAIGAYSVTAKSSAECGESDTANEEFTLNACEPNCAISVTPPQQTRAWAGESSLGIDMCAANATVGNLSVRSAAVSLDGQQLQTLDLSQECSTEIPLATYGLYEITAMVEDDRGIKSTNSCSARFEFIEPPRQTWPFLAAPIAGIARRWRPNPDRDETAPMLGAAGGVMFPLARDSFAPFVQLGALANLSTGDESTVFADVGADFLFDNGAFLGGGVGVWDINLSDTRDASLFVHGGVDTGLRISGNPVQWFLEGRVFPAHLDMTDNNYVGLTGLRIIFGKKD